MEHWGLPDAFTHGSARGRIVLSWGTFKRTTADQAHEFAVLCAQGAALSRGSGLGGGEAAPRPARIWGLRRGGCHTRMTGSIAMAVTPHWANNR